MAVSEDDYLAQAWRDGQCPYCKTPYDPMRRVGSGSFKDGGFCSVRCFGSYHQLTLEERHRRRMENREPEIGGD